MKLLYFAWVRQKIGRSEEDIQLPSNVSTVGELMDMLVKRGPEYAAAFSDVSRLRTAVNQIHGGFDATITNDDEIAFFPPVTGG